jgi:hypothetical protein
MKLTAGWLGVRVACWCVLALLVSDGRAQASDLSDRVDDDLTAADSAASTTVPLPLTAFYSFEERWAKCLLLFGVLSILAARALFYMQDSKARNKAGQRLRVASLFAPMAEREAIKLRQQQLVLDDRHPFRYAIGMQIWGWRDDEVWKQ